MPANLKVEGLITETGVKLRWKPIPRAKYYAIQWLGRDKAWATLWDIEGDEIVPNEGGFIEYVDETAGPMGPGGTYRVAAYFSLGLEGQAVESEPVVLSRKPKRSTLEDLSRRLASKKWPPEVKALIARLKWSQHGWTTLLPKEAGECLGKRIEVEVRSQTLTDDVLDLLAVIFENLHKLVARAEKAFEDYGGYGALDEEDDIKRPRVVIDDSLHEASGRWAMIVEVKGSDYGWHIEFLRQRFKTIWAGD